MSSRYKITKDLINLYLGWFADTKGAEINILRKDAGPDL